MKTIVNNTTSLHTSLPWIRTNLNEKPLTERWCSYTRWYSNVTRISLFNCMTQWYLLLCKIFTVASHARRDKKFQQCWIFKFTFVNSQHILKIFCRARIIHWEWPQVCRWYTAENYQIQNSAVVKVCEKCEDETSKTSFISRVHYDD